MDTTDRSVVFTFTKTRLVFSFSVRACRVSGGESS